MSRGFSPNISNRDKKFWSEKNWRDSYETKTYHISET